MKKVSVIIPNYNGMQYVKRCLGSLMAQTLKDWEILFIDNGSADGSRELVEKEYPLVRVIALPENLGFCGAVNIGIHAATAPYVILLNNDTEAEPEFLQELYNGIRRKPRAFSGGAMMLQFHDREKIDDAGRSLSEAQDRNRIIQKKLKSVEEIDSSQAERLLEINSDISDDEE